MAKTINGIKVGSTTISASSDDEHYPSAKAVYTVLGDIESRLSSI